MTFLGEKSRTGHMSRGKLNAEPRVCMTHLSKKQLTGHRCFGKWSARI